MIDLVQEGFDLAIMPFSPSDSTLIKRTLVKWHHVLCSAPAYLNSHPAPRTPADLAGHNFLLYAYSIYGPEFYFPPQAGWALRHHAAQDGAGIRRGPASQGAEGVEGQTAADPNRCSDLPERVSLARERIVMVEPRGTGMSMSSSGSHATRRWRKTDSNLYGAFPVKWSFLVCCRFFVPSGKAVLRPVACDQVRGARGRGQGTETVAQLGGLPPSDACVLQRLEPH
jgi:hypothetical protein